MELLVARRLVRAPCTCFRFNEEERPAIVVSNKGATVLKRLLLSRSSCGGGGGGYNWEYAGRVATEGAEKSGGRENVEDGTDCEYGKDTWQSGVGGGRTIGLEGGFTAGAGGTDCR